MPYVLEKKGHEWKVCKSIGTGDEVSGKSSGDWHVLRVISCIVLAWGKIILQWRAAKRLPQERASDTTPPPLSHSRLGWENFSSFISVKPFPIHIALSLDRVSDSALILTGCQDYQASPQASVTVRYLALWSSYELRNGLRDAVG